MTDTRAVYLEGPDGDLLAVYGRDMGQVERLMDEGWTRISESEWAEKASDPDTDVHSTGGES